MIPTTITFGDGTDTDTLGMVLLGLKHIGAVCEFTSEDLDEPLEGRVRAIGGALLVTPWINGVEMSDDWETIRLDSLTGIVIL